MNPTDGSGHRLEDLLLREWLVANRIGGYASSTIPSLNTRKYHGLLVAAMAPPVRRMVLLSRVEETVHCDGWPTPLACNEYPGAIFPSGHESLKAFAHQPFPRWAYQGDGWTVEKSLQLLDGENTVVLTYTLLGSKPVELEIRPLLALRSMHELTYQWNARLESEEKSPGHHRIPPTSRTPEVFFAHDGDQFDGRVAGENEPPGTALWYFNTIYRADCERGYAGLEDLWSPGVVRWTSLKPGESVHFVCSSEPIDLAKAIAAAELQCAQATSSAPIVDPPARMTPTDTDHDLLVRAAGTFALDLPLEMIEKTGVAMVTKLPWSPPNVRDALIAFPGVLLVTGRFAQAKAMLLGLAAKLKGGLIPTEFAEDGSEPRYDGADTSLWFVHAAWQYLRYTRDEQTLSKLLDALVQIVRMYRHGAALGVAADRDGLLVSCHPGCGTTWMDARVGEWVVTPRGGRAVEVNALWYNAVRVVEELASRFGRESVARELNVLGATVYAAFNKRFWNADETCCYDVVADHGIDSSVRPNQLLALSLPFAVLSPDRHEAVLDRVRRELLTPVGPRTLSPGEAAYRGRYGGDVQSREGACHNGSVHPWLLGPMVTAAVRLSGRGEASRREARKLLAGVLEYLRGDGLGQIPELFDGNVPHCPGGAIASAPAVGEVLRCYVEDVLDLSPPQLATTVAPPADVVVKPVAPKVTTKR